MFTPQSKDELTEAITLYCNNKDECIEKYGDSNTWNVSNVTDMSIMFYQSKFNGDISGWDVSSVTDMRYMFEDSPFNQDINNWDVSSVKIMYGMFNGSQLKNNPPKWFID